MACILITGGTGLVGKKLTGVLLDKGYTVHVFTRNTKPEELTGAVRYFTWNPETETYDPDALNGVTAVINLAGAGIADKRWTAKRKKEILDSRVQSGKTISRALSETPNTVNVLVQASAIGWYKMDQLGKTEINGFQEDLPASDDYLGETCRAWESAISLPANSSIRVVIVRIGIVLSASGGMAKELLRTIRMGIIPIFGNGKQIVPWIHTDDLNGIFLKAVADEKMTGIYNAVAPESASQNTLAKRIAALGGKNFHIRIRVPSFLLKWLLGELSVELLKSSLISSGKIIKSGFCFRYPNLNSIDH
jgi:uncharacterized protein (TIGR01777 family)